ncbi:MAG: cytochrome c maturation protein CcmE [Pseudomonadota bacterium]
MKPIKRNRRVLYLGVGGLALAMAAGLTFTALSQNIDYFYTPGDVIAATSTGEPLPARRIRLGGLVAEGTVRDGAGVEKIFEVTDGKDKITVTYDGILPDLFSEGQGVIAQGRFGPDGHFKADIILAKHDENYEPKELAGIGDEPTVNDRVAR